MGLPGAVIPTQAGIYSASFAGMRGTSLPNGTER